MKLEQALPIWTELVEAYHHVNRYGGDVAEIYVYRLLSSPPTELPSTREIREAHAHLAQLIDSFTVAFEDASVSVDGRRVGPWLLEYEQRHRWHVAIGRRRDVEIRRIILGPQAPR